MMNKDGDGDAEPAPPLTQRPGPSKVKYAWIMLFEENINVESPFSVVSLSSFIDVADFPWTSIEGVMSPECRYEIRTFTNMPGRFRIFSKIEKGIYILLQF